MNVGRLPPEYIVAISASTFQIVEGWNIETFIDTKGGVHHFKCTTKKLHFEAFLTYNCINNNLKVVWNEGLGNREAEFEPEEKDIKAILKWVTAGITSRMIQEALFLKTGLQMQGYIVND